MDDFGTSFEKREKGGDHLGSGPTFSFENTSSNESGLPTSASGDTFPKIGEFTERDSGGDSSHKQTSFTTSASGSTSTTSHHSMGIGHQLTADGRIKAGDLTFNIPGFNSENAPEAVSPIGDALSPTTTRDEKSGQGLF